MSGITTALAVADKEGLKFEAALGVSPTFELLGPVKVEEFQEF